LQGQCGIGFNHWQFFQIYSVTYLYNYYSITMFNMAIWAMYERFLVKYLNNQKSQSEENTTKNSHFKVFRFILTVVRKVATLFFGKRKDIDHSKKGNIANPSLSKTINNEHLTNISTISQEDEDSLERIRQEQEQQQLKSKVNLLRYAKFYMRSPAGTRVSKVLDQANIPIEARTVLSV